MNFKKLKIEKDYNRLINILLALYVTLCLIFALLYNGFFIKPKAYGKDSENFDLNFSVSAVHGNDTEVSTFNWTYESTLYRSVFIKLSEEEINDVLGSNNVLSYNEGYILLHNPYTYAGNLQKTGQVGGVGFVNWQSGYNYAFTDKVNQEFNTDYVGATVLFGISGTQDGIPFHSTVELTSDVELQYVDSWEDAKEYLINGNNDVLKLGDPNSKPKEVVSSNIPTPQKVTILSNGENPCVVWDNPKDVKKFGDKINIEIGFKPTFKLYYGLHFADTVACNDYIGAWLGKLGTHNGFCVLKNSSATTSNELNGYDMIYDDNYIYDIDPNTDYQKSYIKFAIDQTGKTNLVPFGVGQPPTMSKKLMKGNKQVVGGGDSVWDTLAPEVLSEIKGLFNGGTVGTSDFRIRYTVNDGNKVLVSPWVIAKRNFDNSNNATDDTDISFTDKDDNPIQNPTYLPSNSTNVAQPTMVSSDAWWLNFNGYTANLFTNIGQQMSEWTNDSGGFLGFFGELFNEFPFLSWLLLFSLTLALFLRIFGR